MYAMERKELEQCKGEEWGWLVCRSSVRRRSVVG